MAGGGVGGEEVGRRRSVNTLAVLTRQPIPYECQEIVMIIMIIMIIIMIMIMIIMIRMIFFFVFGCALR